ncbi:hypothetical protein GCM10009838_24560 [Catenulispora subtropica]|uniref:Uncharacterized protein n=1 Tax=Catenulispora subtropica TaxID=450798 RepID=A0ABP5CQ77_9ACTN
MPMPCHGENPEPCAACTHTPSTDLPDKQETVPLIFFSVGAVVLGAGGGAEVGGLAVEAGGACVEAGALAGWEGFEAVPPAGGLSGPAAGCCAPGGTGAEPPGAGALDAEYVPGAVLVTAT